MRAGHDVNEVAPRAGLAAGQMHLQHPERRRLAEDADPGRGVELSLARGRARAGWSNRGTERTAMGQLGEQAERTMQGNGIDDTTSSLPCNRYGRSATRHRGIRLPEFPVPAPPAGVAPACGVETPAPST